MKKQMWFGLLVLGILLIYPSCHDSSKDEPEVATIQLPAVIPNDVPLERDGDFYVFGGDIYLSPDDENHKKFIMALIEKTEQKTSGVLSSQISGSQKSLVSAENISGPQKGIYYTTYWSHIPWLNGEVKYYFDRKEEVSASLKDRVRSCMQEIENNCPGIKFTEITQNCDWEWGFRIAHKDSGRSSSTVGYSCGFTDLNGQWRAGGLSLLTEEIDRASIIHELCHSLGMLHEHQRNNRDTKIEIQRQNMSDAEYNRNFAIEPDTADYGEYDFYSIMHYSAYGSDGKLWIKVKSDYADKQNIIGTVTTLSPGDVSCLNKMYPGKATDSGYWVDQWHFCWSLENRNHPWQYWYWEDKTHDCWFQGGWQWVVLWTYSYWDWGSWSWKTGEVWGWSWGAKPNVIHCGYWFEPHQRWTYEWRDWWFVESVYHGWTIHCGYENWPHQIWTWKDNTHFDK
jgi:hypothetical protein